MLQSGGLGFEESGNLGRREGLINDIITFYYVKCRTSGYDMYYTGDQVIKCVCFFYLGECIHIGNQYLICVGNKRAFIGVCTQCMEFMRGLKMSSSLLSTQKLKYL